MGFCLFKKNAVVRFFIICPNSQKIPFCQLCSNKILTETVFVIRRKSFTTRPVLLKIPSVEIQIFVIDHYYQYARPNDKLPSAKRAFLRPNGKCAG